MLNEWRKPKCHLSPHVVVFITPQSRYRRFIVAICNGISTAEGSHLDQPGQQMDKLSFS